MSEVEKSKTFPEVAWNEKPTWLNDEFFIEILAKDLNKLRDQFSAKIVSIKPAVGAGENYVAGLLRVKVESTLVGATESTTHAYILKYDRYQTPELKQMGIFNKEIRMYRDVIPLLEKEFETVVKETVQFSPKCYFAVEDPVSIMVFDDLNARGYKMAKRHDGLDMDHSKLFLAKLAKFHAASAVHQEKNSTFAGKFQSAYTDDMRSWFEGFINLSYPHFVSVLEETDGLKQYADKLRFLPAKMLDILIRVTQPVPDGFNVLNHGDSWVNNYMFAYDENQHVSDVLFIDFQVSFWASPIVDLIYFLVSSLRYEIRTTEFDYLISYYHSELVENLKKVEYKQKIPTLKDLQIELLDKGVYGGAVCYTLLSLVLAQPSNDSTAENLTIDSDVATALRIAMFRNPLYIRALKVLLPFFEKRGLLEF